jgi:sugar/nucleoside kinase (ribokinase family)
MLRPEDVTDELLGTARHVHVSSLYLQPGLAAGLAGVFRRARGLGVSTSLDTNWDPAEQWASIGSILAETDVFLPNAAELLAITGESDPSRAAAGLVAAGTTVVMKDGARGARPGGTAGRVRLPGRPSRWSTPSGRATASTPVSWPPGSAAAPLRKQCGGPRWPAP